MEKKAILFSKVIDALLDQNHPFPAKYLHLFSDIAPEDLNNLKIIWNQVDSLRKASLLEDLEELEEVDTIVVFDDVARIALDDINPRVRAAAIRILWESPDVKLIPIFINLMKNDQDANVRAEAASALGIYVYKGELEEIPSEKNEILMDQLLKTLEGTDTPVVRRHALEALSYSNHPDVVRYIKKSIDSDEKDWVISALFSMGRSANQKWEKHILKKITDTDTEILCEAIRAAGELELTSARKLLLDMLDEPEDLEDEIRIAIITALSHIGGENVRKSIEGLLENADDDEIKIIEEALEYLEFVDGLPELDMFEFEPENEEDFLILDDLTKDENDDDEI